MVRRDEGFFSAKDNSRLFWTSLVPEAPRAHVGVVHGYGEHLGRLRSAMEALAAEGYAVHAYDNRGHGRADGRRGYVSHWPDYVDDLDIFWGRVRAAAGGKKTFLLSHSHGGLVTLHWLGRNPEGLEGLIFSAPYLKLALKASPLKILGAKMVGSVIPWLPVSSGLTSKDLTRDTAFQKITDDDPLYIRHATPRWFVESTKAQDQAAVLGPSVKLPVFMFCGAEDGVASTPTSKRFFETLGSADKQFKAYPGMRHEPLNELGKEEVFRDIAGWISAHL